MPHRLLVPSIEPFASATEALLALCRWFIRLRWLAAASLFAAKVLLVTTPPSARATNRPPTQPAVLPASTLLVKTKPRVPTKHAPP